MVFEARCWCSRKRTTDFLEFLRPCSCHFLFGKKIFQKNPAPSKVWKKSWGVIRFSLNSNILALHTRPDRVICRFLVPNEKGRTLPAMRGKDNKGWCVRDLSSIITFTPLIWIVRVSLHPSVSANPASASVFWRFHFVCFTLKNSELRLLVVWTSLKIYATLQRFSWNSKRVVCWIFCFPSFDGTAHRLECCC